MLTAGREVPGMCQGTTSSVKPIQLIFYRKLVLNSTSPHHQSASRPLSFAPQEALGRLPGQVLSTAGAGEEQGREVQKESDTEAGERLAPVSAGQTVLEKEPGAARKSRGKEVPGLCVLHALARPGRPAAGSSRAGQKPLGAGAGGAGTHKAGTREGHFREDGVRDLTAKRKRGI